MFGFIKKWCWRQWYLRWFTSMMFFGWNVLSVDPLTCVSMNNQEFKVRPEIISINSNEALFYLYSVKISKSSGSFSNINDPCVKWCVPDAVKDI